MQLETICVCENLLASQAGSGDATLVAKRETNLAFCSLPKQREVFEVEDAKH